MFLIRKYFPFINPFIASDSKRARLFAVLASGLALLALAAVMLWMGAPPMTGRSQDNAMCLDGAWRIWNGQVPHRDFFSHLGALCYYIPWLGMKLSHPCLSALTYGSLVLMAFLAVCSMVILWRRTSALSLFLFTVFLGLLTVTPRPLGDPYFFTDFAMIYNRFGEGVLAVLTLLLFLPLRSGKKAGWADAAESLLAGLLLTALFFLKVSYFGIGLGFCVVAALLRFRSLPQMLICVLSAVGFGAAFLFLTDIPLSVMMTDTQIVAASQDPGKRLYLLALGLLLNLVPLLILISLTWEGRLGAEKEGKLATLKAWALPAVIFGGALLLLATNTQFQEMPLLATAALCGAEVLRRQSQGRVSAFDTGRNLVALCLFLGILLPITIVDAKATFFTVTAQLRNKNIPTEVLKTTNLRDFRFSTHWAGVHHTSIYAATLEEGTALLKRHQQPGMRLFSIMFTDPFQLALGLPPAKGGLTCWTDTVLNQHSHPPFARLLGNATHILVVRVDGLDSPTMQKAYASEWAALKLEPLEKTEHFSLYKIAAP